VSFARVRDGGWCVRDQTFQIATERADRHLTAVLHIEGRSVTDDHAHPTGVLRLVGGAARHLRPSQCQANNADKTP
jgi:hypothetical protein